MPTDKLKNFLNSLSGPLEVQSIHHECILADIDQTSFTWTTSPNSLCLATNKKYFNQAMANSCILGIICPPSVIATCIPADDKVIIVAERAAELFYCIHNERIHRFKDLADCFVETSINPDCMIADTAFISKNVKVGKNVQIGPGCYVGENTIIEDHVELGPNTVVGVDGLFAKNIMGRKKHIKHNGGVKIEKRCKLHSSVIVARSANHGEFTSLEAHVHLGHKSIIGHDVTVGKNSTVSSGVILAGRSRIGKNCWIGAGTMVSNNCSVGSDSTIRIGSIVINNLPAQSDVSGNFATSHHSNLKQYLKKQK